MKSDQHMQQIFQSFWSKLKQKGEGPTRAKILKQSDYSLPERSRSSRCIVFLSIAQDNTMGLIGEINRFLLNIAYAECWFQVAEEYKEDDRISLIHEFCDPHLELSVGRPYSLRNHFIFTTVHLLHQSNQLKRPDWKDELPPDDRIDYKVLEKVMLDWRYCFDFKERIAELNSKEFQEQTRNFRNRLQHQFRTHFDFGLTPIVEREKNDHGITYHFGMLPPLNLNVLIPVLYKQHEIAHEVLQVYWRLVLELCTEWDRRYPV